VTLFPVIRDWIAEFLLEIKDLTASEIGRNMLIEQVTRLVSLCVNENFEYSGEIKLCRVNSCTGYFDNDYSNDKINQSNLFVKHTEV